MATETQQRKPGRTWSPAAKERHRLRKLARAAAPPRIEPLLLDMEEVARALRVSSFTIRAFVRDGSLVPVLMPSTSRRRRAQDLRMRKMLFAVEDVKALVARLRSPAA